MEVKHVDTGKAGKFYIEVAGVQQAEMTYKYIDSHKIDINHTEVQDSLKGKGVGYMLLEAAVTFMREKNIKAIPTCTYAAAVFKKKQEYADRLA